MMDPGIRGDFDVTPDVFHSKDETASPGRCKLYALSIMSKWLIAIPLE